MQKFCLFIAFLLIGSAMMNAQEVLPDTLKEKISDEQALEKELEKELGGIEDSLQNPVSPPASTVQGALSRRSAILNPQISVVGTFFAAVTENPAVVKSRNLGLSEAEMALRAYVDPYSRADFYIAFGREVEDPFVGPDSALAGSGEFEPELEEAYFTTLSLPFGLQLKGGKFRSQFGKINSLHPHALNYLDLPRMYINFLGEEGFTDAGVALSWLIPNPLNFFQELTVEVLSGTVDSPSFNPEGNKLLYSAHLKNFFDLTENSTLELGFSGITGPNDPVGHRTILGGIDLIYKWKPLRRNRYKSFEWTTEALISQRETGSSTITSKAFYSFLRYQFAKRWFIGGRYDYSQFPETDAVNEKALSLIINFFATEFQKVEFQLQRGDPATGTPFLRGLLRVVFVIGAHGAHQY